MSYFDELYRKLFSQPDQKAEHTRLLHEVIRRSDNYLEKYEDWKQSDDASAMLADYARAYHLKQSGIQTDPNVHVFSSLASNGFALTFSADTTKERFQYLFDLLAEKTIPLGYRMVNSDVSMEEKADIVETKEKHYLKPKTNLSETPKEQRYGNILIEHVLVNDRPSYIKLLANIYSDRLYQTPLPHQELIHHLLGEA